jgi:hypothetical protein
MEPSLLHQNEIGSIVFAWVMCVFSALSSPAIWGLFLGQDSNTCPRGLVWIRHCVHCRLASPLALQLLHNALSVWWLIWFIIVFGCWFGKDACRRKPVLFLSRRIKDLSFPHVLPCFRVVFLIMPTRCSTKCMWGVKKLDWFVYCVSALVLLICVHCFVFRCVSSVLTRFWGLVSFL